MASPEQSDNGIKEAAGALEQVGAIEEADLLRRSRGRPGEALRYTAAQLEDAESYRRTPEEGPMQASVKQSQWDMALLVAREDGSISMRELVSDTIGLTPLQAAAVLERMWVLGFLQRKGEPRRYTSGIPGMYGLPTRATRRYHLLPSNDQDQVDEHAKWAASYSPTWALEIRPDEFESYTQQWAREAAVKKEADERRARYLNEANLTELNRRIGAGIRAAVAAECTRRGVSRLPDDEYRWFAGQVSYRHVMAYLGSDGNQELVKEVAKARREVMRKQRDKKRTSSKGSSSSKQ